VTPKRTREIGYRWNLRRLMAEHNMFSTSDLAPHLQERGVDLSPAQIYRIVAQTPERLNLKTLAALCDILSCTPSDLIEPVVEETGRRKLAQANGGGKAKAIRPTRARVTSR
jgi:DNA-binding Xre family transcriptional regulator